MGCGRVGFNQVVVGLGFNQEVVVEERHADAELLDRPGFNQVVVGLTT